MASFGSTKCARNSVASRKVCVGEGKKLHVFWEKLRVFEREFLAGFFRAKNAAFHEKNKRALLDHFSRKQAAQATKSR